MTSVLDVISAVIASVRGESATNVEDAIASNPAQKGQLKRNKSFASLFDDAEFQRLIK